MTRSVNYKGTSQNVSDENYIYLATKNMRRIYIANFTISKIATF